LIDGTIDADSIPNINNIKEVTIGNKVTFIFPVTFMSASNLTKINLPNTIHTIGNGAFIGCSSLSNIIVPNSVTSIEDGVFDNCSSLTSIIFEGKTLEEVQAMTMYPWGIEDTSIIKVA
jgi:hypothetical protein